jgi:two-component system, OmpR family, sensor kinase
MALRRTLFWRVYATVIASLVLLALLSAWAMRAHPAIESSALMRHLHFVIMFLTVAGAVAVAAYPVVGRLTRRLERLKASVDAWGAGDRSARADAKGSDEVAAVAASFNTAAERVERLLAAHRDLLAHASHELRSPLARLSVAVEIYTASPDPTLKPQIMADIAELSGLVDEILLASRLDQAPDPDLAQRADCLELAAEEAARAGAEVRRLGEGPFEVAGSPRLIRRLIRNLLDNARRHGRPPVEVSLARDGGFVVLTVTDEGPGVGEADRARVFEPFHRPAGRAESDGGWGLGLSIVRQIAERHGGTVACLPQDGGARFEVRFSAAS